MAQCKSQRLPCLRANRAPTVGIVSLLRWREFACMGAMDATVMYISNCRPHQRGPMGMATLEDLEAVERVPEVTRAMPVVRGPATARYGDVTWQCDTATASP